MKIKYKKCMYDNQIVCLNNQIIVLILFIFCIYKIAKAAIYN